MSFGLLLGTQPLHGVGTGSGISGFLLQQFRECPCCDNRPTRGHRNTSRKGTCCKPPSHSSTALRASGLVRLSSLGAQGRISETAFYCRTQCTFRNRPPSNSRDTVHFHRLRTSGLGHCFSPGSPQLISSSPSPPPASPKGFPGRCHALLV